ncbi:uncharacterized protein LOC123539492 [Mercenaria mercenaria]|uniref:uncharacterized protein LOC123539492 n=1 Tax=Mercenaria mercenaria TaxID=6596 RepID=UPI00234EA4DC|nr:uncharacterized protein LOC123539492 [Mercenaria mercenaria]
MGAHISKQKSKRRIYLSKGKVPRAWKKIFKRKKKYVVIEQDEVDSAEPYTHEHSKAKNDTDTNTQRSISVETTANGNLEVCIGYDNIPSDTSEWEKESMSSCEILDSEQDRPRPSCSLQRNESDRRTAYSPDSAMDVSYTTNFSGDDCALCNANNTEYMVQVFMPTLQRHLDVKEILPYLHYICHNDARALSNTEPQELAVKNLIDTIQCKVDPQEQGKWATFLVALDKTGNIYLHQLLTGKTEKDHFFTNEILKLMKPNLINDICLNDVMDHLIEREIINEEDQGYIESAAKSQGPIPAIRIMLEKVDKRLPDWDAKFTEVLDKAGMSEIADVFKMVEHHEHVGPKGDENFKKKTQNRKLKKAKRGKCRLHNQVHNIPTNDASNEPESKRKKMSVCLTSEDNGVTNEAFAMPLNVQHGHKENDKMKKYTAEIKDVQSSVETMMVKQTDLISKMDDLMDIMNEQMIKSAEERNLLKQQISEQSQALHCLTQMVSKLITN